MTGRSPWRPAPRPVEDLVLLSGLTALAVMGLAWSWPVWGEAIRLVCPFRALTGLACPTCGGTRALVAAAHGELGAALRLNPLAALAATGLMAWIPLSAAWFAGGWPRPDLDRWMPALGGMAARVGAALVGANWMWVAFQGTV